MRWLALGLVLLVACAQEPSEQGSAPGPGTVRLLFAGDVMLGRGVAEIGAGDPGALLSGVRQAVAAAEVAVANLESPLTLRPHDPASGPNALEASPASAALLAAAGFDAIGIANNHAGDAGPLTVTDTLAALEEEGLESVGAGRGVADAFAPTILEADGIRVALLAFDASGQGPHAGPSIQGVAWWDERLVREAVERARRSADVVAVGIHGGLEYSGVSDPYLRRLARLLGLWGADVVWGHGPHVVQPVRAIDPDGDGRPTVVATSLGNLLFDQHAPGTRRGALLEVVAAADGVHAFRVGVTDARDGPARFAGWRLPGGDAVGLDGSWWRLARDVVPMPIRRPRDPERFDGAVVDSALGDVDGDGRLDLIVAFRRAYRPSEVNELFPGRMLIDLRGRSAHVGLYRPGDLRPRWVAGTLLRPVVALAPCDGYLAVAYSRLDEPEVVAAGAWRWGGFGFIPLPDLRGSGVPACVDVDLDGLLDPLVLGRSAP